MDQYTVSQYSWTICAPALLQTPPHAHSIAIKVISALHTTETHHLGTFTKSGIFTSLEALTYMVMFVSFFINVLAE